MWSAVLKIGGNHALLNLRTFMLTLIFCTSVCLTKPHSFEFYMILEKETEANIVPKSSQKREEIDI